MRISKSAIAKQVDLVVAFFVPALVLLGTFIALQMYPFGERGFADHDLYLQYLPIMSELHRIMHEGGSIFYSFHGGLGTDFYSLSTYQNASPLTWVFLALFPRDQLVFCTMLLLLSKVGLIGAAMCYYLRSCDEEAKAADIPRGADKAQKASHGQETSQKHGRARKDSVLAGSAVRIALATLYALSAYVVAYNSNLMWLDTVALLPLVVLGLRRAVAGRGNTLYLVALALMLFSCFYLGLIACIFVAFYFFVYYYSECFGKDGQSLGRSLVRVSGLSLLAACMTMVVLLPNVFALAKTNDFATLGHGLAFTFYYDVSTIVAQLLPATTITRVFGPPNLYAGLISLLLFFLFVMNPGIAKRTRILKGALVLFIIVSTNTVALESFWHFFHLPNGFPARYSFVLAFMLIEISAESLRHKDALTVKHYVAALLLVLSLYAIALAGAQPAAFDRRFMIFVGVALLALYSFAFVVTRNTRGDLFKPLLATAMAFEAVLLCFYGIGAGGVMQEENYASYAAEVDSFLELVEQEDPFARLETVGTDNPCAPYVYGYKGASIFASSVPASTYAMLNGLLQSMEADPRLFVYARPDAIGDALFNIGYVVSFGAERQEPWLKKRAELNGCYLYESAYHTALGFMLSNDAQAFDFAESRTELQSDFVRMSLERAQNIASSENNAAGAQAAGQDASSEAHIAGGGSVSLDDWDTLFPKLFSEKLQVKTMEGNRLEGSISAQQDGILMTTIPYDEGWQVQVDGQEIETTNSLQHIVSFPLTEGEHTIEMTFTPRGFVAGALISLVACAVCFVCVLRQHQKARTQKRN